MILPNGLILDFLERCCAESAVVIDFTKSDNDFERIYRHTKTEYRSMIRGLEKQIANCRQDLRNNVYDKIKEIQAANTFDHSDKKQKDV